VGTCLQGGRLAAARDKRKGKSRSTGKGKGAAARDGVSVTSAKGAGAAQDDASLSKVAPTEEAFPDEETALEEEEEFVDGEAAPDIAEFDEADVDGDEDDTLDVEIELTSKEQSARALEIRRKIEERMEERQFHEDIDYLDFDLDD
jgi:hypothetical protein